jgi:outer membrane usher protein FimD/PapC
VPAGPFTLDDVPEVRSNVDLEVTVVESDGSTNRFIVPAASVMARKLSRPRVSVLVGQVNDIKGIMKILGCLTFLTVGVYCLG